MPARDVLAQDATGRTRSTGDLLAIIAIQFGARGCFYVSYPPFRYNNPTDTWTEMTGKLPDKMVFISTMFVDNLC